MNKRASVTFTYAGNGLYSIADAADILRVPSNRLRHWVQGYYYDTASGRKHKVAVVPRFYGEGAPALSFVELIELLFVSRFRQAGLKMEYIRIAAARAREQFGTNYPFAVKRFSSDGRGIFITVDAETQPRTVTHEIVSGQVVFENIVRRYFKYHIDIEGDFARRYWPLGRKGRVVIDAGRAFGEPIDSKTGVPTQSLAAAVAAGDAEHEVAEWFDVPIEAVRAAVKYETLPLAA